MSQFRKNPTVAAELTALPGMRLVLAEAAHEVARTTRTLAPRHSSYYRRTVQVGNDDAGSPIVYTTDIAGHLVEFGSANNPAYAPIRRAVRAAGLRLDESSK